MQEQSYEPTELVHVAFAGHVVSSSHSFTSEQLTPSPEKPDAHAHSNEPIRFVQTPWTEQLCVPSAHSSSLSHSRPSPWKPFGHEHE